MTSPISQAAPLDVLARAIGAALGQPNATAAERDAGLDIVGVDRIIDEAAQQRVTGLLLAALDRGAIPNRADEMRRALEPAHLDALRTSLAAEAVSVEVVQWFDGAGIRSVILKGCATAHLDYANPATRSTGDVDVLIDRDDRDRALGVLAAHGLDRLEPAFRDGWERRYGKDIPVIGASRIEVDLHLTLAQGYFGIVLTIAELMRHTASYEVAGRTMTALDAAGRLVHAAIHTAATTPIRLGSAADVVVIANSGNVDRDRFVERVHELGCDGIVAAGVIRAFEIFDVEASDLARWAADHVPDAAQQRALAALEATGGEVQWLSGAQALPWHRRPGYVLPLAFPSRAHLASRHRNYLEHLRTSFRRVRPGQP